MGEWKKRLCVHIYVIPDPSLTPTFVSSSASMMSISSLLSIVRCSSAFIASAFSSASRLSAASFSTCTGHGRRLIGWWVDGSGWMDGRFVCQYMGECPSFSICVNDG